MCFNLDLLLTKQINHSNSLQTDQVQISVLKPKQSHNDSSMKLYYISYQQAPSLTSGTKIGNYLTMILLYIVVVSYFLSIVLQGIKVCCMCQRTPKEAIHQHVI